jgi:hypothetical protein
MNKTSSGQELDPFRSRQVPDVGRRFLDARNSSQRQADLLWLGTMIALFSDHELKLMHDLGFLSQHDRDLLSQAGRPVTP